MFTQNNPRYQRDIIVGKEELKAFYASIPFRVTSALPKIVDVMLVPYQQEMKRALVPRKRSGLLRQSIKRKVTVYNLGVAYGIVGPDRDVTGEYGRKKDGTPKPVRPANYSHLVDLGTRPHRLRRRDTGQTEAYLIIPKRANRKPYYKTRKVYEGFGRLHPGAKPYPFRLMALAAGAAQSLAAGKAMVAKLAKDLGLTPNKAA